MRRLHSPDTNPPVQQSVAVKFITLGNVSRSSMDSEDTRTNPLLAPTDTVATTPVVTPRYYSNRFYESEGSSAEASAKVIVPLLLDIFSPNSVVDVGCGTGAFVREFSRNGVGDVLGIDGKWVIDGNHLVIPSRNFMPADLGTPLPITRRYDMALSLEVGEHLEASQADSFVQTLCRLAPVVIFSAAVPLQFGTHHVNERWPSYWAKKFRRHGYVASDCLRPQVFHERLVESWYATNTFAYIWSPDLNKFPAFVQECVVDHTEFKVRNVRHPRYTTLVNSLPPPVRHALYLMVRSTWGIAVDRGLAHDK